jgi:transposase-like protein
VDTTVAGTSDGVPAPSVELAYSEKFYTEECEAKYIGLAGRDVIAERSADLHAFKESGFTRFLGYLKVRTAASVFDEYDRDLVDEFYSNIHMDNVIPGSEWYNRVYVRGRVVNFTTEMINEYLGMPQASEIPDPVPVGVEKNMHKVAAEISGGLKMEWPSVGKFLASSLTLRYFCLFKVAVQCWCPSSNHTMVSQEMGVLIYCLGTRQPVNLGLFIHHTLVAYAISPRSSLIIYPCLITALLRMEGIDSSGSVQKMVSPAAWKPTSRTLTKRAVLDLPWRAANQVPQTDEAQKQARVAAIDARLRICREITMKIGAEIVALDEERRTLLGLPIHRDEDEDESSEETETDTDSEETEEQ